MGGMRLRSLAAAVPLAALVALAVPSPTEAAGAKQIPLKCSKGPSGQHYDVSPQVPAQVAEGATFSARFDGVDSGTISQTGLNHVKDMTYVFGIPDGTRYVEGSARVVPGTGSANVREGAKVSASGGAVFLTLGAHVDNGQSYTPPSLELKLVATGKAGDAISFPFRQYQVTANAVIIGDLRATCDPVPKPYVVATTKVVAADAAK